MSVPRPPSQQSSASNGRFELVGPGQRLLAARPGDLDEAIAQFQAASVADAGAAEARDRVLAFCRRHPEALNRSCLTGHLTGSAFVVDRAAERTLLLHHAKLDRWLQPGGHADGDGNLAAVAWREATEETGVVGLRLVRPAIDIDIHHIPGRPGEPEHLHLDLRFAVIAPDDAIVAPNHESLAARWAEPGDPTIVGSGDLERGLSRALDVVRQLR